MSVPKLGLGGMKTQPKENSNTKFAMKLGGMGLPLNKVVASDPSNSLSDEKDAPVGLTGMPPLKLPVPTNVPSLKLGTGISKPILDLTNCGRSAFDDEKPKHPPKPADKEGETDLGDGLEKLDQTIQGVSRRFRVGYADTIGPRRETMEDKMVVLGSFRDRRDEDYFAVFDGHGGTSAAIYCAQELHKHLANNLANTDTQPSGIFSAIQDSFSDCHESMKAHITESGTTAVVLYFMRNQFYVANVGDSRAVISRAGKARALTIDQKPTSQIEQMRIARLGGFVVGKRVMARLAVARALGDYALNPFICCDPEIFGPFNIKEQEEYQQNEVIVMACDGIWDYLKDQEAIDIALNSSTPKKAAMRIREKAIKEYGTKDNVSVIVLFFDGYNAPESVSSSESSSDDSSDSDSDTDDSDSSSESSDSDSSSAESKESEESISPKEKK